MRFVIILSHLPFGQYSKEGCTGFELGCGARMVGSNPTKPTHDQKLKQNKNRRNFSHLYVNGRVTPRTSIIYSEIRSVMKTGVRCNPKSEPAIELGYFG